MKIKVGILGATGSVGVALLSMLYHHPYFEVITLGASSRSHHKTLRECIPSISHPSLPSEILTKQIKPCEVQYFEDVQVIFSALNAEAAKHIEPTFADVGRVVISNARNYRMAKHTPLIIPEINPNHIELLGPSAKGKMVTNPNCVACPLASALYPLVHHDTLQAVYVTSFQAISGGGYRGVSGFEIQDNLIPYIAGEEDKIESEPLKILGSIDSRVNDVILSKLSIHAITFRAMVSHGHTIGLHIEYPQKAPSKETVYKYYHQWKNPLKPLNLPSAPDPFFVLHDDPYLPQLVNLRHKPADMQIHIGRVRSSGNHLSMVVMAHNLIRGAAGGALLNAELLYSKNRL